jgi:hypothetical protein
MVYHEKNPFCHESFGVQPLLIVKMLSVTHYSIIMSIFPGVVRVSKMAFQ